jgi:hypothetical protein
MYNGNYLTSTLTTLSTAPAATAASIGLGNVANTSPSGLPISTATQTALNTKLAIANPTYTGILSNVASTFQVDGSGVANCVDLKFNSGTSLITSFSSINTIIPTLATNNCVNNSLANYQPLDATNTLTNLPINLATMNSYFNGFPNDQPVWSMLNSASYTNMI